MAPGIRNVQIYGENSLHEYLARLRYAEAHGASMSDHEKFQYARATQGLREGLIQHYGAKLQRDVNELAARIKEAETRLADAKRRSYSIPANVTAQAEAMAKELPHMSDSEIKDSWTHVVELNDRNLSRAYGYHVVSELKRRAFPTNPATGDVSKRAGLNSYANRVGDFVKGLSFMDTPDVRAAQAMGDDATRKLLSKFDEIATARSVLGRADMVDTSRIKITRKFNAAGQTGTDVEILDESPPSQLEQIQQAAHPYTEEPRADTQVMGMDA